VIRDGHGGEIEFLRLFHQAIHTASAIEQGILGVQMKMNKIGMSHSIKLGFKPQRSKANFAVQPQKRI
jgi:hypothetical protein